MNEPYSGFEGLIHSARRHGIGNGAHYLEIEVNNALLGSDAEAGAIARRVAPAIAAVVDSLPPRRV
jgi:predicted N-formylglutamate amidohydrolase